MRSKYSDRFNSIRGKLSSAGRNKSWVKDGERSKQRESNMEP